MITFLFIKLASRSGSAKVAIRKPMRMLAGKEAAKKKLIAGNSISRYKPKSNEDISEDFNGFSTKTCFFNHRLFYSLPMLRCLRLIALKKPNYN